jgi:Na+/H+ antiporter NhaA
MSDSSNNSKQKLSLEAGVERVITPFQEFIHDQRSASGLLLLSTIAALIIANSPFAQGNRGQTTFFKANQIISSIDIY